jgi:tetratricopeptide (TPR) repeat protein
MMFGWRRTNNLIGSCRQKAGFTFLIMMLLLAVTSHAAKDPFARAMQLYKKHHYEDAVQLLYKHLPSAESDHRAKTYLALGMICLANADLYQDLFQASTATNLDYLNRLLSAKGPAESRLVNLYLGKTLLETGKLSEAAAFFKKFLAVENGNPRDKDLAKIDLATAFFLQNDQAKAHALWSQVKKTPPELSISLAAAYSRVGLMDKKPLATCKTALDLQRRSGRVPSIQIINNLIYVYSKNGQVDAGFELINRADLKAFFHEEAPAPNKVIRFYDSALLSNLSAFYANAALKFLEKAYASQDQKVKGLAQYYLGQGYDRLDNPDQSMRIMNEFISSAGNPQRLKNRARVRQAFNHYLLGDKQTATQQLTGLLQSEPESNLVAEMLLSAIRYQFDAPQVVIQASAMAQRGQGRSFSRINFALGKYYLWKKNYPKAISHMEAGRDKSNKNRVEFNDPLMLVNLARAYYRSRQFSEALEIFFEMSKHYAAVRQIQDALQGVYIMEQKSAGDVKIF